MASKTKKLTTCAILIALSTVLVLLSKLIPAPWLQGGSITIASMVPIIAASIIIDSKWGVLSGAVFALIQMMTGFYPPPVKTFMYFFLVIFLDYILAFGVLGLGGFIYRLMKKKIWAIPLSGAIVTVMRYICHIISGVLIWSSNANEGQGALAYSITYNGSYMIPEIIITTIVLALLARFIEKQYKIYN